eukprot:snap_masked-scaffold_1-processed-gene-12.8-mRNA-1 protein AED:0.41 eAED:0.41 QI:0/0/0/1/1/1/2/0/644
MNSVSQQKIKDFSDKTYWDRFFKEQPDNFEWYDIKELFLDRARDSNCRILVVGCGNSSLSEDIFKLGFRNILSIDFSPVVIHDMKLKYKHIPELLFEERDVLTLSKKYSNSFDIIIDKGFIDAVISEPLQEVVSNGRNMLEEIKKCLKDGGTYFCVSLAQHFIIDTILETFTNYKKEIYTLQKEEGNSFIPFALVFSKGNEISLNIDNYIVTNLERVNQTLDNIRIRNKLRSEINSNILIRTNIMETNKVKYTISLFENRKQHSIKGGVFIVPQGLESSEEFSQEENLVHLAESNQIQYLFVVYLSRGFSEYFKITDMKNIQKELSPYIITIINDNNKLLLFTKSEIETLPFFGLGETETEKIGSRKPIYERENVIVEEVLISSDTYRRLLFKSKLTLHEVIQSETRLTLDGNPDFKYLCFEVHLAIVAALLLRPNFNEILLIGLGGGNLVNFILTWVEIFPDVKITVIEIDSKVVNIAKVFFGLNKLLKKYKEKLTVIVEDGIKYLKETQNKYDIVIYDIDNKQQQTGLFGPPKSFLSSSILTQISATVLKPDGSLIINFSIGRTKLLIVDDCIGFISKHFPSITKIPITESCNFVITASHEMKPTKTLAINAKRKLKGISIEQSKDIGNFIDVSMAFPVSLS